jgi:triosephosphate isomerase
MRSRHLLIGNWKMNLGPTDATAFARSLRSELPTIAKTDVWIAPPTISIAAVRAVLGEASDIALGAQNVHWANSGAFTGETAPAFLQDLGATFSLVGHSERRTYFGETSEQVALRANAALAANLIPVVCFGESESERSEGRTEAVIEQQLVPVLAGLTNDAAARLVLAYEPVWAIGTGKVASLQEIAAAHKFIHAVWSRYNFSSPAVVLYGGSVNPNNFADILALEDVDGALVGGASIKLDQWLSLIQIAEQI